METRVVRMTAEEADALYVAARIHLFEMKDNHPNYELLGSAIKKFARANVIIINMGDDDEDSTPHDEGALRVSG